MERTPDPVVDESKKSRERRPVFAWVLVAAHAAVMTVSVVLLQPMTALFGSKRLGVGSIRRCPSQSALRISLGELNKPQRKTHFSPRAFLNNRGCVCRGVKRRRDLQQHGGGLFRATGKSYTHRLL